MENDRTIPRIAILLMLVMSTGIAQEIQGEYRVEKIADGFQFLEGPVWKDGGILFSDIPANTVYRWQSDSGVTVYLSPSGNSNGLSLDPAGELLLAQHGKRRVALLEKDGTERSLASEYHGKRLNSPNDMAARSDGSIFFTDPPYGIPPEKEELGFYGIYRISPEGNLRLLDSSLTRPNGITFTPDEKKLYVDDSEARIIYVWDVLNDSQIVNKRRFASMEPPGNADGMKVDRNGILYATGPLGVWVYDPDGTILDTILIPGQTTNCNWGDKDRNTLYVTSGPALYQVRKIKPGSGDHRQGMNLNRCIDLYPLNRDPSSRISYIAFDVFRQDRAKIPVLNFSRGILSILPVPAAFYQDPGCVGFTGRFHL